MSCKLVCLLLAAVCLNVTNGTLHGGDGFGGGGGLIGGGYAGGFGRIWCTCRWKCLIGESTFRKYCVLFPLITPFQKDTCCKRLPWWATDFYRGGYGGIGGGGFGDGFFGGGGAGLGIGGGFGGKSY